MTGYFKDHWADKKAAIADSVSSGKCLIEEATIGTGRRIIVTCPYNEAFAMGARELTGRFSPKTKRWSFGVDSKRLVIELANNVFGDNVEVS